LGNTVLGVALMLLSTSMMNLGAVLQKKAVDALPAFDATPVLESVRAVLGTPLWLLGWGMATFAIVLNMVALGLADISIIQPLNGFGLVVLVLASRWLLGERMDTLAAAGVGLVVAGVAAVGFTLPESRVFADAGTLLAVYAQPVAIGSLAGFALLAGLAWVAARRLLRWAGILLAFAAALCSVVGLSFSKGYFGLLALEGLGPVLGSGRPWLLLVLLLGFSVTAMLLQQLSFQKGRAVVVTPVFAAASVVLPLLVGWLVFGERLPVATLAGPALIVLGVVLIGMRAQGSPAGGPS
jgi:drug/metabolite transporter (DMT)-like permease